MLLAFAAGCRPRLPHLETSMSLVRRTVPFLLLPIVASPLFAQDKVAPKHLLRMTPAVGTKGDYVQVQEMTNDMAMGGRNMKTTQTTTIYSTATTKAVEGGKASIDQKYTRITAKADGMMGKVDYDSANEDSSPGAMARLEDLVDQTLTLVMNDRGKVVETKTSNEFPNDAIESTGIGLEQALAQCVPEFPEKEIAIGESWTTTMTLPLPQLGEMECKVVNKLVEVADGKAKLEQEFEFDTSKLTLPPGAKLEAKKTTGFTRIDLVSGLPVESVSTMTMNIEANGVGGAMQMTMSSINKLSRAVPAKEAAAPKEGLQKDGEQKAK